MRNRQLSFPDDGLPKIIRGKYKLRILWNLQDGALRFGILRKKLGNGSAGTKEVAPRVLGRELKSMVELGLIHRRAYNVIPPKVEYRLAASGRALIPVISIFLEWKRKHLMRKKLNPIPDRPPSERLREASA